MFWYCCCCQVQQSTSILDYWDECMNSCFHVIDKAKSIKVILLLQYNQKEYLKESRWALPWGAMINSRKQLLMPTPSFSMTGLDSSVFSSKHTFCFPQHHIFCLLVPCHLGWRTLVLKCNKNNYDWLSPSPKNWKLLIKNTWKQTTIFKVMHAFSVGRLREVLCHIFYDFK